MSSDGREGAGKFLFHTWTHTARISRAIAVLLMIWGGMIVSVFIPGLHLILVPLLFVAGLVGAVLIYRQKQMLLKGEAPCPACGGENSLAKQAIRFPKQIQCVKCGVNLSITGSE